MIRPSREDDITIAGRGPRGAVLCVGAVHQAAAEYVGVLITDVVRAVGSAGQSVLRFAGDHPLAIAGGVVVLFVLWRLLSRR